MSKESIPDCFLSLPKKQLSRETGKKLETVGVPENKGVKTQGTKGSLFQPQRTPSVKWLKRNRIRH